jgi:hypothetical protein
MRWIAPSEKDTATVTLERRLWDAADQFRANSGLKSQEYSAPVLGLIFLRFAEVRFAAQRAKLEKAEASSRRGSRVDEPPAYHAEGILYLPAEARFDYLLNRPEAEDIGGKVNAAMRDIEKHNPQLAGVLPKTYNLFTSTLLKEPLKKVSEIPASVDYDGSCKVERVDLFYFEFVCSLLFYVDEQRHRLDAGSAPAGPRSRGSLLANPGQRQEPCRIRRPSGPRRRAPSSRLRDRAQRGSDGRGDRSRRSFRRRGWKVRQRGSSYALTRTAPIARHAARTTRGIEDAPVIGLDPLGQQPT